MLALARALTTLGFLAFAAAGIILHWPTGWPSVAFVVAVFTAPGKDL